MKSSAAATVAVVVGMIFAGSASANFGDALPGLTSDQLDRFKLGRAQFATAENVADGLGPVFNDRACSACHTGPSSAIGGTNERLETRFGTVLRSGVFDPLADLGGSLLQTQSIGLGDATAGLPAGCPAFPVEIVPSPQATVVAGRRTTPLFGLGLVDATPDSTFVNLAATELASTPATAGIVSLVPNPDTGQTNVVGRFGWKAQNPTLHVFAGDAYLNEMGITNPSFPEENCPNELPNTKSCLQCVPGQGRALDDDGEDVTLFTDFMSFLAPPPPGTLAPSDKEGEKQFTRVGCASCHTPTLTTGPNAVKALDRQTYHPYSDFLLHDMGALGDGITQNQATGHLMRTAPLWGVRTQSSLLHDGRAATVTDAILAHDGQAAAARNQFNGLNAEQQRKLLGFVNSL